MHTHKRYRNIPDKAGEMAQWLRTLAAPAGRSVFNSQRPSVTAVPGDPMCSLRVLGMHAVHRHTCKQILVHIKIKGIIAVEGGAAAAAQKYSTA